MKNEVNLWESGLQKTKTKFFQGLKKYNYLIINIVYII